MSTPGRVRGNYAKTPERRREILEASIEVFSSSGFRSGSLRDIAERVGMSQAGLLHHFANKGELLAAVLRLRDDRAEEFVPLRGAEGLETITGFVNLVEYNATVPGLVELHCVLSAEATDPSHPAHAYFVDRYQWVVHDLTRAFEDMRGKGQLAEGVDPASAARAITAFSDGIQVQWLLDRTSVDMAEEMRRFLRPLVTVEI